MFTRGEMSAILGQPVTGTGATTDGHSDYCTFGAGRPVHPGTKYLVGASSQLTCPPKPAAEVWNAYAASGLPLKGDPRIVSLSGKGTNDAIRLRNGCTFSSTVGLNGATGNVVAGSQQALQSALEGAYERTTS